jgi:hypothetical protein
LWVTGPFKSGRWNCIKLYRRTLKVQLFPGKIVEADRGGYRGNETSRCTDTVVSQADKRAKQKERARHETVNGRLKNWVLATVFQHERNLYKFVFYAVAVLTQISLRIDLFSVRY